MQTGCYIVLTYLCNYILGCMCIYLRPHKLDSHPPGFPILKQRADFTYILNILVQLQSSQTNAFSRSVSVASASVGGSYS